MTIVVTALALVVVVLAVLVAGLLRSHAVMLRRLHDVGVPELGDDRTPLPADQETPRPNDAATGRGGADLSGVSPVGDSVAIAVTGRRHDTALLFLSSDCLTCQPFWEAVGDGRAARASRTDRRLVVVTKGPEAELSATIAGRSADVPVVMSTQAWQDYEVPGSPYVVHVDGPSGRVRGEGTSASWDQLLELADRGSAETADAFAADDDRPARDSDDELRAIGIQPGDSSLYPDADPGEQDG